VAAVVAKGSAMQGDFRNQIFNQASLNQAGASGLRSKSSQNSLRRDFIFT
jgi:hypothetical protein